MNKELIVLMGPTAIGKTMAGIEIAKNLGTEIISADSRQIYKEMSIGTAVPDKDQLQEVKHYFIQTRSIHETYNASNFETDVLELLENLFKKHDKVLMVGGSGLYIDAALNGIDDLPDADPELRAGLQKQLNEEGIESLRNDLRLLDPVSYKKIDLRNPKRVQKALEVSIQTGKPYSSFLSSPRKNRSFKVRMACINTDREELYHRINLRVLEMIQKGLIEEVKSLLPQRNLNALKTVGYKELFSYFDGDISREKAIEKIQAKTRKYARKQLTWFKKYKECQWFGKKETENILKWIDT
jgi:tRNA dimethylallyltransferase